MTSLPLQWFETGLAGAIFLKLGSYRVQTAIVVQPEEKTSQRFHELMHESKRSRQLRFFADEAEAVAWLMG